MIFQKSKEARWVDSHKETHYTLMQMARKFNMPRPNLLMVLPSPCKVYNGGNKSRLWCKDKMDRLLG